MTFSAIHEYDAVTAGNNTDIGGVGIQENAPFANMNNALRELCRQIRVAVASQGSDIASATTTDIGAATGQYVKVTGTTTITALGTVNAGTMRWVEFSGALTLTHNGTSLKLPTSANITTAAGDTACFVSLGSGNWKCLRYMRADGSPLALTGSSAAISSASAGTLLTVTSTDAGAGDGPDIDLFRNSASPAASDFIGQIKFTGKDSGGNTTTYGLLAAQILTTTDGAEDSLWFLRTLRSGSTVDWVVDKGALRTSSLAEKGSGTINAAGLYVNGFGAAGPVYIIQDQKSSGSNGGGLSSGSWVKRTLNTEVLDEITITTSSSVMALPAGTYKAHWSTTMYATGPSQSRLQDTTNTVTLGIGHNIVAGSSNGGVSVGHAYFVLAGSANVELQCRVTTTNATDGGGQATSWGTEVYSTVYLEKVA